MTGLRYIDLGADDSGTETLLPATHFGPRGFENDLPAEYVQSQGDKVQELTYNFETDTTTYTADQDSSRLIVPANSWIVGGYVTCLVPYTGTSINLTLNDATTDAEVVTLETVLSAEQATAGAVIDMGVTAQLITADLTIGVVPTAMTVGESTLTLIYRTLDDRTGSDQS